MSRKSLDILFASGGAVLALVLVVIGFIMADQHSFAQNYVKTELSAQKIYFATDEDLAADKTANPDNAVLDWKPGSKCLTQYAGQLMTTGKQAECFAKYYLAMHMSRSAKNLKFSAPIDVKLGSGTETLTTMEGQTYATIGTIRTALAADQAALTKSGDKTAADARQKDVDAAASLRTTMQTGETLRGLLLTTYGFSTFGDMAGFTAWASFIGAVVLAIVAGGGFVHAFLENRRTSTTKAPAAGGAAGARTLEPR